MDVGLLISMVREREPLWNRQHPQYKDRELASKLWSQVAGKLKVDIETARYKWRGLRDTFRVQLRKHKTNGKGGNQSLITPKWEYFNEMKFVKDQIHLDVNNRTKKGKHYDVKFEENNYFEGESAGEEEYLNFDIFCETEMTEGDQVLDSHFQNSEIPKENGHCSEDDSLRLTPEKPNIDQTNVQAQLESIFSNVFASLEDDNLCFLLSLLPQLKSLPNKRNLYVRLKMQQLLLDEVARTQNDS